MTSPKDTSRTVVASLLAGGVDTPYERVGRGQALLLLVSSSLERTARTLVGRLSAHCRVFRPDLVTSVWAAAEPVTVPPDRWLLELVEGIGLDGPIVVAESWVGSRLRALRSDDRFRAWIELGEGPPDVVVERVLRQLAAAVDGESLDGTG